MKQDSRPAGAEAVLGNLRRLELTSEQAGVLLDATGSTVGRWDVPVRRTQGGHRRYGIFDILLWAVEQERIRIEQSEDDLMAAVERALSDVPQMSPGVAAKIASMLQAVSA